ncbi:MAG: YraN family protein [Desulfurivibrionaceae bacterium]|nr:YraN family protein [Desulfobulbales bacterium]MDT8335541.1 YraN family protein [Desulfurivibrionaceae bacterium]
MAEEVNKKHLTLGRRGEELARRFLQKGGYRILETNYRGLLGEIDLVAREGDCLVFVEVKTRSTAAYGHPFESINPRKQYQLSKVAGEYLAAHGGAEQFCRFDAVSVLLAGGEPRIELVKNAFEIDGRKGR